MGNIQIIRSVGVLDGDPEQAFDRIVTLVARTLGCPISLVSIIDKDGDRQFFKAAQGLASTLSETRETPLFHSFCKTVVATHDVVDVSDARKDPRFRDNPAVADFNIMAYLGAPVVDRTGAAVGSLCAVAPEPRTWTTDDRDILQTLAAAVSREIWMRTALIEQKTLNSELCAAQRRFTGLAANVPGAIFRYLLYPDGRDEVEYMSPGCLDIWEVEATEVEKDTAQLRATVVPEYVNDFRASIARSAEHMEKWHHRWRVVTRSGKGKWQ